LVLMGVGIGALLTMAATHLIESALFGVSSSDLLTIGVAGFLMIGIAVVASFIPARRASLVDPAVALRYE